MTLIMTIDTNSQSNSTWDPWDGVEMRWHLHQKGKSRVSMFKYAGNHVKWIWFNMVQHYDLGYRGWLQQPGSTSNVQNVGASGSNPCLLALYNVTFFPKSLGHSFYWSNAISLIKPHCIVAISCQTNTVCVCDCLKVGYPLWWFVTKSGFHFDGLSHFDGLAPFCFLDLFGISPFSSKP